MPASRRSAWTVFRLHHQPSHPRLSIGWAFSGCLNVYRVSNSFAHHWWIALTFWWQVNCPLPFGVFRLPQSSQRQPENGVSAVRRHFG
ncbi:hypothetical protein [Kingella sp. (in: b-proteobacteria)]|uniref:hypothetical protein n=1 Tax=Kingella sp. (in: b-proteobacteria) TaxID=2020713 RepID=UPI0026DAC2BB|nr:hypothetical protein [Kingella sp. (in: b-proteobacteria)]MDO4657750.1 hypothetical protein [Kingella sp. (in: b-proteobacteria)]